MLKVFVTDVVISKGFDNQPALRYSTSQNGGEILRFRFGSKIYDPRSENNSRWINMSVKAFGPIVERIKKMNLKEGSFINLSGRLDEEVWVDPNSNEKKSQFAIVLDEIEYAGGGVAKSKENRSDLLSDNTPSETVGAPNPELSPNWTGYTPIGENSFFNI